MSPDIQQSLKGASASELGEILWEIEKQYYHTKPVDIHTFLHDKHYLGNSLFPEGSRILRKYWEDFLYKIYPNPFYSPYYEIILLTARGTGKSTCSSVSICYDLYRLLCMNDPHAYFRILKGDRIVFSLFSSSKELATDTNWNTVQNLISYSPFFGSTLLDRKGLASGLARFPNSIEIEVGSQQSHTLGKAIFGGCLDEASHQNETGGQARKSYNGLSASMETRFMQKGGMLPGTLWLLSSPKNSSAWLDKKVAEYRATKGKYVISFLPLWMVKDQDQYSGKTFKFYLGGLRDPFIVSSEDQIQALPPEDLERVIDVPTEHYHKFRDEPLDAIRDLAGFTLYSGIDLFKTKEKISDAMKTPHRFTQEVFHLPFFDESVKIESFLNDKYFDKIDNPQCLRFLHIDVGTGEDRLGLASVYAMPTNETYFTNDLEKVKTMDRHYVVDFLLYIKARPGEEVPLHKVEDFIKYLWDKGYPIRLFTSDSYQSKRSKMELRLKGIQTGYVSVDKDNQPYRYLRDMVNRGCIDLPKHSLLRDELIGLRDDGSKVDHQNNTSKDGADGVAGALWSCLHSTKVTDYSISFVPKRESLDNMLKEAARRQMRQTFSSNFDRRYKL